MDGILILNTTQSIFINLNNQTSLPKEIDNSTLLDISLPGRSYINLYIIPYFKKISTTENNSLINASISISLGEDKTKSNHKCNPVQMILVLILTFKRKFLWA